MNAETLSRLPGRYVTTETIVGSSFLGIVILLMIPVPPSVLDLLLAMSIGISAVVFLTALFSERPTDFSIFPTLLLISTLLRLSLNIASTRLILNNGHEGPDAAGRVIYAFSNFVVGGNMAVGLIIFLALVIINFVVITKGAGRIAEVAARFTLDALPGKQMSIDAELQAGAINEDEARKRRAQLDQQADFYRSMDGANKFIRGDAIAGLIITAINLIGGLGIGAVQHNLGISEAATTYSMLSIGDGLVSQMPALVVSTAAGLAISRSTARSEFGREVVQQMLGIRRVLGLAAGFLFLIGMLPGLPMFPFAALSSAMVFTAYRQGKVAEAEEKQAEVEAAEAATPEEEPRAQVLSVEPITLEVGLNLIPLVNGPKGDLTDRVKKLRRQVARSLGLWVPQVRFVDNMQLGDREYTIKLNGSKVATGEVVPDRLLVINFTGDDKVDGLPAKDPVFGMDGLWISSDEKRRVEARGHTVVEPSSVIITHLAEIMKTNAEHLLRRDDVHELVDLVREVAPKLIEGLLPAQLGYAELSSVLKLLLAERVSIRDLRTILETLALHVGRTKHPEELAELVRTALRRQICDEVTGPDGIVHAMVLDPNLEQEVRGSIAPTGDLMLTVRAQRALLGSMEELLSAQGPEQPSPCLLVAADLRRAIAKALPDALRTAVKVLKPDEVVSELRLHGTVTL